MKINRPRLLLSLVALAGLAVLCGCSSHTDDAPKPANGTYYTGALMKKPAGAQPKGIMTPGVTAGAPK